jgi:CRP/FNR family transcriptional regulator, cyclic AMP receptor protein
VNKRAIPRLNLGRSNGNRTDELEAISSLLYDMELFKGLERAEIALSFDKARERNYKAGDMVFTPEDSSCERLYILRKGRVNLYRINEGGKRLVTRKILPGSVFGVRALLGRVMQKNFAEAVEDSTVCTITREQILTLLKRRPELLLQITEMVCKRLSLLEERLVETVYNSASVRLAYFLLTNADSTTGLLSNVTHEEIGDTIGAVRQTVTENLSHMRNKGLILTESKRIKIIDRQGLEEIIKGAKISRLS